METIDEILDAVRRLSEDERQRLVDALHGMSDELVHEGQRRDALSSWLSLAGTFHSEYSDVSRNKYQHLSDVYADNR